MKYLKLIGTVCAVIILTSATTLYLSSLNKQLFGEETPIPHFFPDSDNSFKYSFILFLMVFILFGLYFLFKKYINLVISLVGMGVGVFKYQSIVSTFPTKNMGFVPGLVEFGKILCIFMLVGIILQWIVDIGLFTARKVKKQK